MAKHTATSRSFGEIVRIHRLHWFKELNAARQSLNYGDDKQVSELKTSLAVHGWKCDDNGMIKVERMDPPKLERALKERELFWEDLKGTAKQNSDKVIDLNVFEEIYTDGKGKLRQDIDFCPITANRRGTLYFAAMVQRRVSNLGDITVDVPIIIEEHANALDRLISQVDENEFKTQGFLEMSMVDKLLAAKEILSLGGTQTHLRRAFKDGTGMKLHGVLVLNRRFPNLGIVERCKLPQDDPRWINLAALPQNLSPLVLRTDAEELEKENARIRKSGKGDPIRPAEEKDVEEQLGKKQGTNLPKILPRKEIESLMQNSELLIVRAVARSVMENNTDPITLYNKASVEFNALDGLLKENDAPPFGLILSKALALKGEARKEYIAKLVEIAQNS